jgi:hypothetical protein
MIRKVVKFSLASITIILFLYFLDVMISYELLPENRAGVN